MNRILIGLAVAILWVGCANAQTTTSARVVATCGTISYTTGGPQPMTMDTTGTLCTVSGGGGGSNPAAGATGSAVPADASYNGVNVGGNLRGQTGVNPSGSVYAGQNDITSVNGTTVLVNTCTVGVSAQTTSLS